MNTNPAQPITNPLENNPILNPSSLQTQISANNIQQSTGYTPQLEKKQIIPKYKLILASKKIRIAIIGLLILMVAGILYLIMLPRDEIIIEDQKLGDTVHIKKLKLTQPGVLALIPKSKYNKPVFNEILGYTDWLPSDTYTDFDMELLPYSSARVPDSTSLVSNRFVEVKSGSFLYGVIYHFANTKSIGFTEDRVNQIAKNIFGQKILEMFKIK